MADERYVIDILVQAKDQTGAAMASVQEKVKGMNKNFKEIDKTLMDFDRRLHKTSDGIKKELDQTLQKLGGSLDNTNTKADKLMRTMQKQDEQMSSSRKTLRDLNKELGDNADETENARIRIKNYATQATRLENKLIELRKEVVKGEDAQKAHKRVIEDTEKSLRAWNNRAQIQLDLLNDLGEATDGLNESGKERERMLKSEEEGMLGLRDAYIKVNEQRKIAERAGAENMVKDLDAQIERMMQRAEDHQRAINTLSSPLRSDRFDNRITHDPTEIARRRAAELDEKRAARERLQDLAQVALFERNLIEDSIKAENERHKNKLENSGIEKTDQERQQKEFERLQDNRLKTIRRTEDQIARLTEAGARNREEKDRLLASGADPADLAALDTKYSSIQTKGARAMAEMDRAVNIDVETNTGDALVELAILKRELEHVEGHYTVDFDVATAKARMELAAFNHAKNEAAEAPDESGHGRFFDAMKNGFKSLKSEADRSRNSIAQFDNTLRGGFVFAAVLALQQLVTILIAAGGQLVAVASSAIMAGGALAGGLTAGVAQAIPMIGILAAALARLGAVFEAVKQASLLKEQQFAEGQKGDQAAADNTDALASAHDGLRNALNGVADAQRNLAEAQLNLTRARFESSRQLQDMILQEKQAALAAQGAALSQRDAAIALQQGIATGDIGSLRSNQLDLSQARLDTKGANRDYSRANQDLNLQTSGSPLRPDRGVEEARKAIEEAKRALVDAQRAAEAARRGIKQAAQGAAVAGAAGLASASKMDYMLKQLSGSERKLYQAITGLRDTYKKAFRPITDIMVDSFTLGAKRAEKVLKDPGLIGSFMTLSKAMGDGFDRITKQFTSPRWIQFFTQMTKEAAKNVGPMVGTFMSLARTFRNIAEAASPLWSRMVRWIRDGAKAFEEWVGKGSELEAFFEEGEKHLKSWFGLIGAVTELFLTLIGASAESGRKTVEDFTKQVEAATEWIKTHGKETAQFFEDSREVIGEVANVIKDLGAAMFRLFDPASVAALAEIFSDVLIPALEDTIRGFGTMFKALEKVAQVPGVSNLLKWLVIGAMVSKVMHSLAGSVRGLVVFVGTLGGWFLKLGTKMLPATAATDALVISFGRFAPLVAMLMNPISLIVLAVVALGAAFVVLAHKFGVWDDVVRAAKKGFNSFVDQVKPAVDDLLDAFKRFGKVFGVFGGDAKGLGKVFRWLFITVVKNVVVPALEEFGEIAGKILGGVIKVFTGFLNIVTDILTGDFKKIPGHFKDMLGGIWDILSGLTQRFTLPFRLAFRLIWAIIGGGLKKAAGAIGDGIEWIWNQLKKMPGLAKKAVTGFVSAYVGLGSKVLNTLKNGFESVWDFLKKMPGRMVTAGTNVAKAFARGIGKIPDLIADAFKGAGEMVGKIVGSITKFINDKTKFGDDVDLGLFSIHLPALPEKFAKGGPVPGSGSGDTVHALLTPGEHVLTKGEVAAAGGHGAIFAMRSALGGGFQGRNGRFALGGQVPNAKDAPSQIGNAKKPDADTLGMDVLLAIINSFGKDASKLWNGIWEDIRKTTIRSNDKILLDTDKSFDKMLKTSKRQLKKFSDAFKDSFSRAKKTTGKGFKYIIETTNDSLKSFGVDPIKMGVAPPSDDEGGENRASGGYIGGRRGFATGFLGNQGERGGDKIPAWLGRGEAVLNYAQQRFVEPALRKVYGMGLGDMFGRTDSRHGAERTGGYAGGRDPRFRWPTEIRTLTSDFGPRSSPTAGASSMHDGIDIGVPDGTPVHATADGHVTMAAPNGGYGNYVELAHSGGISSFYGHLMKWIVRAGQQVKAGQQIAVSDNTGTSTGAHLHFGMHDNGTPIDPLPLLQGGALSGAAAAIEKIKKLKVKGDAGPLKDIVQAALNMGVNKANKFIESKVPQDNILGGNFANIEASSNNQKMGKQMLQRIWSLAQWPALQELWTRESGWDEGATNPSSGAYGIPQSLPASKMGPAAQGTGPAAAKAQIAWGLQYIKERYGSPSAALDFHDANNGYARGKRRKDDLEGIVRGKVSYFGGQDTAGGKTADNDAGLALNLKPGTDSGWNNAKTQKWMRASNAGRPYYADVGINGHSSILPIIDLGPAGWVDRAIDVTTPGVSKLGFSTSNFPTDAMGEAWLLGQSKETRDGSPSDTGGSSEDEEDVKKKIKLVQKKLSDREFKRHLPNSLRPAVNDFDGWFKRRFGKDPSRFKSGSFADPLDSIRDSVSSWAEDFLDQARTYTAKMRGDKVIDPWVDREEHDHKKKKKKKKKKYAEGGFVQGGEGEPVDVTAHAGEIILNKAQQAVLGGGNYLKSLFGFDGAPKQAYASGGEIHIGTSVGSHMPKLPKTMIGRFIQSAQEVFKDVNKTLTAGAKTFKDDGLVLNNVIHGVFDRLIGDGGVLDSIRAGFETMDQIMGTNLANAQVKIGKGGRTKGRALQPDQILGLEAKQIHSEMSYLLGEKGTIRKAMQTARKALKAANKNANKDYKEQIKEQQKDLSKAEKDLDKADTKKEKKKAHDAIEAIEKKIKKTRKDKGNKELTDAQKTAETVAKNLEARVRENNEAIAEKRLEALAKMEEKMAAAVDKVNEREDSARTGVEQKGRIDAARGNSTEANAKAVAEENISIAKRQIAALRKLMRKAASQGNEELATELSDQIAELGVTIVEGAASLIQITADFIQDRLSKVDTSVGLKDRWGAVFSGIGMSEWGNAVQGAGLQERQSGLSSALSESQALLDSANSQGLGETITGPLQDTVNELIMQMAENGLAILENTITQRQLSIDMIESRQGFLGGVSDSLMNALRATGVTSGVIDFPRMIALLQEAQDQIVMTGSDLRDQMSRFVTENISQMPASAATALQSLNGLSGVGFIDAVNQIDIGAISEQLGGQDSPVAQQFQALLQQLINNENATLDNTNQLNEAVIQQRQSSIDLINNRQNQLGGISSGLMGIIRSIGVPTGTVDFSRVIGMMTDALGNLFSTGSDLREQMSLFTAENMSNLPASAAAALQSLQGLQGADFVDAIDQLDVGSIMEGLGGQNAPLAQQFQALLQQLIENEAATVDNTNQINEAKIQQRQFVIDLINNRQGFLGGVSDSLMGTVRAAGVSTGITDFPRLITLMEGAYNQIVATGSSLRDQMSSFVTDNIAQLPAGIASALQGLQGLSGVDFTDALQQIDLATISDQLGGQNSPLAQQFQALLQQLISNENATLENSNSIDEAKIQQRQFSIDLINSRQGFLGGVTSGLAQIVESVGTMIGTVDLPMLVSILQRALDQLIVTGDNLRNQMTRFVEEAGTALPNGVQNVLSTLQGLHGSDFVQAILGLDQNAIVDQLGGQSNPIAQQFQALIQQLIDNEAAIMDNTNQLNEANKQNKIQSFTSSAWNWFRSALFNGVGGLMPQYSAGTPYYNMEGMAGGGIAEGDGPRFLHDGELVSPPNLSRALITLARTGAIATGMSDGSLQGTQIADRLGSRVSNGMAGSLQMEASGSEYKKLREALLTNAQNINIEVNEAETGTDYTYLSQRVAHATKIPTT